MDVLSGERIAGTSTSQLRASAIYSVRSTHGQLVHVATPKTAPVSCARS